MKVWSISNAAPDPEEQSSGTLGDLAIDAKIGVGQGVQALAGAADFVARPFRTKDDATWSEELGTYRGEDVVGSNRWMAKQRSRYSPGRQQLETDYQNEKDSTDSEWGKAAISAKHLLTHPTLLAGRVINSLPEMVAGAAIPGAPMARIARMAGAGAKGVRTAATVGSALGEGAMSGAHNAFDTINTNVQEGADRYRGVGTNQLITAGGVAAMSLLGAKVGGSVEAALFNKEARESLQAGWKGVARGAGAEGMEEALQAPWETIPQNVALDKPWYEGLGENVAEGALAGGAMGGAMHGGLVFGRDKESMLGDAPVAKRKPAEKPLLLPAPQPQASALPAGIGASVAQPEPAPVAPQPVQPQTPDIVGDAAKQTPMAGTQPVPPTPAPQPTKEELKAQQDAAKIEKQKQQEALKAYRKRYGLRLTDPVPPEEVQAEAEWRTQNAEDDRRLDALIKAAVTLPEDQRGTPQDLRDIAMEFHGKSDEELAQLAEQIDATRDGSKTDDASADFVSTAIHMMLDPEGDAATYLKGRKSDQAQEAYRQAYGDEPSRQASIHEGEIKADKQWRSSHRADVPFLDVLVKANVASGAHITPKRLRELAQNHHSFKGEALAQKFAEYSTQSRDPAEADFNAAVVDTLTHPDGDLSQFIQKRKADRAATEQAALDKKAQEVKAREEAQAAKAEKKAKKEAEKKAKAEEKVKAEEKPKILRVPTSDEWEAMSEYDRKKALDDAEASGDTSFLVSLVALDEAFKEYQAKETARAEKAKTEKKAEKAPKEEAPNAEETPKEEKPAEAKKEDAPSEPPVYVDKTVWAEGPRAGDVSVVDGREAIWMRSPESVDSYTPGEGGRVLRKWKEPADLSHEAQTLLNAFYHTQKPIGGGKYTSGDREAALRYYKASTALHEYEARWEDAMAPYWDRLRGLLLSKDYETGEYAYVSTTAEQTKLQKKLRKKAKVEHLADLEAVEAVMRKYYYPDFSLDLDWLREKAGKKPGEALKEAGGIKEESSTDAASELTLSLLEWDRSKYQEWLQKGKEAAPAAEEKPKAKKATKKEAAKAEEKPVEAPKEQAPKEEALKAETPLEYDELMKRPDNERKEAFVKAAKDKKLVDTLKEAGLLDKRVKSIAFRTISSPEFQEKVSKLTDTKYFDTVRELIAMGRLVDENYNLELPTEEQVQNSNDTEMQAADGKAAAATRTRNKKAIAAARQVQEIGTETPETAEGKRDALILHSYFTKHYDAAEEEAGAVSSTDGMKKNAVISQAVRGVYRPEREAQRMEYLAKAKEEGLDAKVDSRMKEHATELESEDDYMSEAQEVAREATTNSEVGETIRDEDGDVRTTDKMRVVGSYQQSRVEPSAGEAAGTKAVDTLKEAYKGVDLSKIDTNDAEQVIRAFTAVEQAVVAKLPKALRSPVIDPETGKVSYEFTADGVAQAALEYFMFAGEYFDESPDAVKVWFANESPFMKWLAPQMERIHREVRGKETEKTDDINTMGRYAVPTHGASWNATASKTWAKQTTLAELGKKLQSVKGTDAKALAQEAVYVRTDTYEGLSLPLQSIVKCQGSIEAALQEIFSPEAAKVIAKGISDFQTAGLPIPNAYVSDVSTQIGKNTALEGASTDSNGRFLSTGASTTASPQSVVHVLSRAPGRVNASSYIFLWAGHSETTSTDVANLEAMRANTLLTHEMLHSLESEIVFAETGEKRFNLAQWQKYAGYDLGAAVLKTSEFRVADVLAELLKRVIYGESLPSAVVSLSKDSDAAPYLGDALALYYQLAPEERVALAQTLSYPPDRATQVANSGADPLVTSIVFGREMLATLGELILGAPAAEKAIKRLFPKMASAWQTAHTTLKAKGAQYVTTSNKSSVPGGQTASYGHAVTSGVLQNVPRGLHSGGLGRSAERETSRAPGEAESAEDKRAAHVEQFINESLKLGEAGAKVQGIDPKLYDDPEWQRLAKEYAEAHYASMQANGSVAGYKSVIARENKQGVRAGDTPENHQKLQDAMKRKEAAELELTKKRMAFDAFEESHRKKDAAPKGEVVEQAGIQFGYNKVAEAVGRRFKSPALRDIVNNAGAWAYHHGLGLMFTRDLVDSVKDKLQSITKWAKVNDRIDQLSREHQDKAVKIGQDFRNLSQKEQDAVNLCLEDSVIDGHWYDVPTDKFGAELLEDIEITDNSAYNKLSSAAQKVYRDVLAMGIETRRTIRKYTLEEIERRYAKRIENAKDADRAEELRNEARMAMELADKRLGDDKKPYVPLRRFGNYVVVLKSQKYADAVAYYEALREATKEEGATVRDRRDLEKARQAVLSMQSNGEDYIVEYAESASDAMTRASELEKDAVEGSRASYFERANFMKSEQLNLQQMLNWVDRAERQASGVDDDFSGQSQMVKDKLNELATTMYIQALSDNSALKSRLHRRKVAGASHDMMRAFMSTASSESRYLGYLKYGSDLREALSNMEDEARTSSKRAAAQAVFNEVRKRIEQDLTPQSTAASGILRTTSVMMLLTNPAFFLQNLSQPLLYSASYMAGRHGLYRPLSMTAKQMKTVAGWLKSDGTLSDLDKLVENKEITADERTMLTTMRENGLLDIGLSQEFGEFNRDAMSPIMGKLAGVTDMLASAARKVEVINRAASALVAYRLEKARLMNAGESQASAESKATKFADHVLYETHGDYSSRNAPRYFKANDFARVVTQFRKFQLIQLGLFTRMLKQALDKTPSEERHFARVGLAYTLGSFLAVTGVKGLPLYGIIALALGLAGGPGDDDEDVMRKALADAGVEKPVVELIVRGLPAMLGVDLSDKLGAGNVLSPFPYLEGNKMLMKNGPDDALEVLAQVLGPAASLLVRGARGASYGWQGDYTKAAENLLPSGFANLIKAVRFGTDGITTKAGDVVIPGEEFTFGDLIMQGMGLPTTKVTNRNLLTSSLYRHEEAFNRRAKEIRYSFTQAVKNHDIKARLAAIREWSKMNEDRRKAGFAPNKLTNLTSSAKQQVKRERGAVGGVETNKSNRGFVRKASELYS